MFGCFKKKKAKPPIKRPPMETQDDIDENDIIDEIEEPTTLEIKRIALIDGHSEESSGADTYKINGHRSSEHIWTGHRNYAIANKLSCDVDIFDRTKIGIKGVAKQLKKYEPTIVIDHHFNSIGHKKAAYGKEILLLEKYKGSKSEEIARGLLDAMDEKFPGRRRHDDGIKWIGPGDRGRYQLEKWDDCGAECIMLFEMFFGGFRTAESARFLEGEGPQIYSKLIADYLESL